jgi:hypothetical protein
MSDQPAAPSAAQSEPAPSAAQAQMSSLLSRLSLGERLLAVGALLLVLGDIVFDIFLDYSFSDTAWLAGVIALVLILVHVRPTNGLSVPDGAYRLALVILGVVAFLSGVRWLLFDLQVFSGAMSVSYLLGALCFYAGVILMGIGAFQVFRRAS